MAAAVFDLHCPSLHVHVQWFVIICTRTQNTKWKRLTSQFENVMLFMAFYGNIL